MRHLALAHLCILFAVFPAPGSCQETEEPFASPIFQEHGEKKKDPPKRDADRKNLPGEVSKLDIEDLSREIERLAQEISAAAIKAAKKNSVDNEDFTREMETLRREMGKMAQEINAQARRAGNLAQSQPSDALLASARAQRLRGRYAEAAELYSQYIANNPNSSRLFEARFWYAKSLFEDQKWKEAAAAFTEFLQKHPDQRTFSQVAKGDRIHCWKMQPKDTKAVASLKGALNDPDSDTRILAALALAENKIPDGRKVLEESVENPKFGEQCALALWRLGLRPQPKTKQGDAPWARLVVVKVKTEDDSFEIKVPLTFIRGLEKMMPDDARIEMERAGVPKIDALSELAASAPKGTTIFQYKGKDGKTFVVISVE